jgi:hypothetical protein
MNQMWLLIGHLVSLESARCGSPNSALSRTAVAYVTGRFTDAEWATVKPNAARARALMPSASLPEVPDAKRDEMTFHLIHGGACACR